MMKSPSQKYIKKRDKLAYQLAWKYLLSIDKVNNALINRHINRAIRKPKSLSGIFLHFLGTAQNRIMAPSVIGKSIGGINNLRRVFPGFDPFKTVKRYGDDDKRLLKDIVRKLRPRGKVHKNKRAMWPAYCKAALSSAKFLTQFNSISAFIKWVDFFDRDERASAALPMIISYEVDGIGFALACDFLKELGYLNFGKPDVHIKKIFYSLGLCEDRTDYHILKAIRRVAGNVKRTAFHVDKLLWLIGSGNFYRDGLKLGRHREKFIKFAKKAMKVKLGRYE